MSCHKNTFREHLCSTVQRYNLMEHLTGARSWYKKDKVVNETKSVENVF